MAFARPTLSALIERISADIEDRLSGARASLARTTEGVLARVFALAVHGLHGHLEWISQQILPDTADDGGVLRWGEIMALTRNPATVATGKLSGTGTATTTLPAGSELQNAEGTLYTTDNLETVNGGGDLTSVEITAVDAGADGNVDIGEVLRLTSPVAGIDSEFTVIDDGSGGGLTGGVDIEDIEAYRLRILARIGDPANGGAVNDYVQWAKEIAGVTRVWEDALALGPGTVRVLFVRDDDTGSIIPSAAEVSTVQDHLQETNGSGEIVGGKAPLTAQVTVVAPSAVTMDVTADISRDTSVAEATVTANITAELEDMLLEHAEPGGTIRLSQIREAISRATGEVYHDLTAPAADVTHAATELPVLGTVSLNYI